MKAHPLSTLALLFMLLGCGAEPPTALDAVIVDPSGGEAPADGVTARWTRVRYNATGSVTLAIRNGVATLRFSPDFTVDQTPGPFVYLNTTNNANTGRALRVGALRARRGEQVYTFQVPAGVQYTHVLIWCDPFNVPMVEAVIPPTGAP